MKKNITITLNDLETDFLLAFFKPKDSSLEEFCSVLKQGLLTYPHLTCALKNVLSDEKLDEILDKVSKDFRFDLNLYLLAGDIDGI